jgi:hypothetical protein
MARIEVDLELAVEVILLDVRKQVNQQPGVLDLIHVGAVQLLIGDRPKVTGRQHSMSAGVVMASQAELLRLLAQLTRLAASPIFCTAGSSRAISTAMMAITTSSSINVKPFRFAKLIR